MSFNLLWGGGDDARFERVLGTIAALEPDVVMLQECVDWDGSDRLERAARALAVPCEPRHAMLGQAIQRRTKRMDCAVVSRLPLEQARAHTGDHVTHVLLDVRVEWSGEELRLLGAHLTASDQAYRMKEALWIRQELGDALATQPILLMGDLNSLSRRDPYSEEFLRAPGTPKFGAPVSFEILDLLEEAGFVDTLRAPFQTEWPEPRPWVTAPRKYGLIREDYVLASRPLAARLERAWVGPLDESVSDHAPVIARFV